MNLRRIAASFAALAAGVCSLAGVGAAFMFAIGRIDFSILASAADFVTNGQFSPQFSISAATADVIFDNPFKLITYPLIWLLECSAWMAVFLIPADFFRDLSLYFSVENYTEYKKLKNEAVDEANRVYELGPLVSIKTEPNGKYVAIEVPNGFLRVRGQYSSIAKGSRVWRLRGSIFVESNGETLKFDDVKFPLWLR